MVNAQGFVLPCVIIISHSDRFVKRKSHKNLTELDFCANIYLQLRIGGEKSEYQDSTNKKDCEDDSG